MSSLAEVTDTGFEKDVVKSATPTIVKFWAEWCGPCKAMNPVVEQVAKEFEGKIKIVGMNVDENQDIPGTLGITGIPALVFFKGGKEVARLVGTATRAKLTDEIKRNLGV
jgi:thioredoxin 1